MSVLRSVERRLEGFFEGLFGRAFKSYVQPVELARKLAKEMDDRVTRSVSQAYAPNEYAVYLSPEDREQFASFESALCAELAAYLGEHAARERLVLLGDPRVTLETDDDLPVGTFGIASDLIAAPEAAPEPPPPRSSTVMYPPPAAAPEHGVPADDLATRVSGPAGPPSSAVAAVLVIEEGPGSGRRYDVAAAKVTIGRSRDCDFVVGDTNVSRRHAEVRRRPDGTFVVADLGSTNGTEVDGRRAPELPLADGDRIGLGTTTLRFELAPPARGQ